MLPLPEIKTEKDGKGRPVRLREDSKTGIPLNKQKPCHYLYGKLNTNQFVQSLASQGISDAKVHYKNILGDFVRKLKICLNIIRNNFLISFTIKLRHENTVVKIKKQNSFLELFMFMLGLFSGLLAEYIRKFTIVS